jgi:hypothetical protein
LTIGVSSILWRAIRVPYDILGEMAQELDDLRVAKSDPSQDMTYLVRRAAKEIELNCRGNGSRVGGIETEWIDQLRRHDDYLDLPPEIIDAVEPVKQTTDSFKKMTHYGADVNHMNKYRQEARQLSHLLKTHHAKITGMPYVEATPHGGETATLVILNLGEEAQFSAECTLLDSNMCHPLGWRESKERKIRLGTNQQGTLEIALYQNLGRESVVPIHWVEFRRWASGGLENVKVDGTQRHAPNAQNEIRINVFSEPPLEEGFECEYVVKLGSSKEGVALEQVAGGNGNN